jgi:hypothetical protein
MQYIEKITSENTGGHCCVDFVHLKDGRVIGINDECAVLYADMNDFWECDTVDRPCFEFPKTLTDKDAENLAFKAFTVAIASIQDSLGQTDGGHAGLYFSGELKSAITTIFKNYAKSEFQNTNAKI